MRSTGRCGWLPVELTLVNDLPINTRPEKVRVWFGDTRAERSRVPDLLPRRQRVRPRGRQELLGEGGVARRVPDQDATGQSGDSVGGKPLKQLVLTLSPGPLDRPS